MAIRSESAEMGQENTISIACIDRFLIVRRSTQRFFNRSAIGYQTH